MSAKYLFLLRKRRLAGESEFSQDFNGLAENPLNPLCFPIASDRGYHLCALALGISQYRSEAEIISAFGLKFTFPRSPRGWPLRAFIPAVPAPVADPQKGT
jgi:hypothetical protein